MNPAHPQSQTPHSMLSLAHWCAAVAASEQGVRFEQALCAIRNGEAARLQHVGHHS